MLNSLRPYFGAELIDVGGREEVHQRDGQHAISYRAQADGHARLGLQRRRDPLAYHHRRKQGEVNLLNVVYYIVLGETLLRKIAPPFW